MRFKCCLCYCVDTMTARQSHVRGIHPATASTDGAHKRSTKRKTVHVTLWMKPETKAELQHFASKDGVSVSKFGGTLLEEAIHQELHIQHAVLIQPIIEQAIRKQMGLFITRLT